MKANIVTLPGDGIGPEVIDGAIQVMRAVAEKYGHEFTFEEHLLGGCSIDKYGVSLTDETLAACQASDAVLLGAVGGPKWDDPNAKERPEKGLLGLRKGLQAYANIRPVRPNANLLDASPLRPERLEGVDMVVVRELTGGIYFGEPKEKGMVDGKEYSFDTMHYWDWEVDRIVRLAFDIARGRKKHLISIDKANVLEVSRLWRRTVEKVAQDYPDCTYEHLLVDAAAMHLITKPAYFDVAVTGNMFGDIITDEASVLTGSMGNLPSASLGDGTGIYEPIHGSAPDIAGEGIANPIGMILSAAMMLRHSFNLETEAAAVEAAVDGTIGAGVRTLDLNWGKPGSVGTREMAHEIVSRL